MNDEINTDPTKYHILSEYDTVSLYSFYQIFVIQQVIMRFVDVKFHGVLYGRYFVWYSRAGIFRSLFHVDVVLLFFEKLTRKTIS